MYFSEALSFYNPQIVLLWGFLSRHISGKLRISCDGKVPSQKDIEHAVMEGLLKGITEEQRQRFVAH